jgi:UDP-N-acetylglucosamine diphosphorylase / glucose-1-phosphate thymidylyltransferase / UDP-N-acetylgalactosamine diphosphorylase / glucosamine-1-phosphate N-acetyltransferase / galactosamine-1-phosphate N-acetyltransferase
MAGRGSRFVGAGVQTPKPLIDVLGRPMYAWATESLPLGLARRLVFVCLDEHLRARPVGGRSLEDDIRTRYPDHDVHVVALDHVTDGQVCTVLEAAPLIDRDEPLLVYNADTWCRTDLEQTLPQVPADVDGIIGVFEAEGDHWSFARTDEAGRVVETAEKRRISRWATTGLYWFASGARFVAEGRAMVADDDRTRGEFFVAPLYDRMIRAGAHVRTNRALEVAAMGTPDELEEFKRLFGPEGPGALAWRAVARDGSGGPPARPPRQGNRRQGKTTRSL